jgi:hypothetical protein
LEDFLSELVFSEFTMIARLLRAALTFAVLAFAANYFYTHHEEVETLRFRVVAAAVLLGLVFVLCALKAAMISLSPDVLEAEIAAGNPMAKVILRFRRDGAYMILVIGFMITLSTLFLGDLTEAAMPSIWGKIGVALTIAIIAEVIADYVGIKYKMKLAHALSPLTQLLFDLLVFVKPISWLITRILGHEEEEKIKEGVLAHMVRKQWSHDDTELKDYEAHGILHVMETDHLPMRELGNPVDAKSMVAWERFEDGLPVIPAAGTREYQELLERIAGSMRRWFIFTDGNGAPRAMLDARRFGAELGYRGAEAAPIYHFLHRAKVVPGDMELGDAILSFELESENPRENVVKIDALLITSGEGLKIYTAADNFGDKVTGLVRVRNQAVV